MSSTPSLDALQGIHRDLIALSESRLLAVDRLLNELEAQVEEFRKLLSKKVKNDESRKRLSAGKIGLESRDEARHCDVLTRALQDVLQIDNQDYQINDDFRQNVLQIADELDLDELESAHLFIEGQEYASALDRSPIVTAILRFHQQRQFLLEDLQLILQLVHDGTVEGLVAEALQTFVNLVLEDPDRQSAKGTKYWRKCVGYLNDVEAWLQRVADRSQRASVLGESFTTDAKQILEIEAAALNSQHESLASICTYLIQNNLEGTDLRNIIARIRAFDKHDMLTIHYLPILLRLLHDLGQTGGHLSNEEVESLTAVILSEKETELWLLRGFHAAAVLAWYAQIASRGIELPVLPTDKPQGDENYARVAKLLQDGALHFLLSVAQDVRRNEWPDPVKRAIVDYLLQDTTRLSQDTTFPSPPFQTLLSNQLQELCDAIITNLPDTLRRMRQDADEERRSFRGRLQGATIEAQPNLERFLLLIAYAYDQDPDRAIAFWDDQEANLYGFLQWTAKRQTTPRVAAFCEMLRSISQDSACADAAHKFLLEEGAPVAGKLRRTGSLSWAQIFAELEYYANHLHNRESNPQSLQSTDPAALVEQLVEPESALMLECYLRFVTHLCSHSEVVRNWILRNEAHDLSTTLYQLAATNIESRLRASAFSALASLLTDKSIDISNHMWVHLDHWASGGMTPNPQAARPGLPQSAPTRSEAMMFDVIYSGYEETNAFVRLLNALIAPAGSNGVINDLLPFPETLGTSYRTSGISAYVDFIVGRAFSQKSVQLIDTSDQQILRLNCLEFIAISLSTFNEDLVVLANKSTESIESSMRCSSLESYILLHPFARTMEWLLTSRVLAALFATAHQDIDSINLASPDSPLVLSVLKSIEIMNLVLKYQSVFLDIVRPVLRKASATRRPHIDTDVSAIEDAVLGNLQLVVDLGLYCGTGHQDLILSSLALLEGLSSSKKLALAPSAGFGKRGDRSKLLGILEKDGEAERIARSLSSTLDVDSRETENGPMAAGYVIKSRVLSFLLNSLNAAQNKPSISHALLGFDCYSSEQGIIPSEQFAEGEALFQGIARLSLTYPGTATAACFSWVETIKTSCLEILQSLWRSPLTSTWIMSELHSADFIYALALRQTLVGPGLELDGKILGDPEFLFAESVIALQNILRQRTMFFDLFTRSVHIAVSQGLAGDLARLLSTLNGTTTFPGSAALSHATLFDLFDFQNLNLPAPPSMPDLDLLRSLDLAACQITTNSGQVMYDIPRVQELLLLRRNTFTSNALVPQTPQNQQGSQVNSEMQRMDDEADVITLCLLALNHHQQLVSARLATLKAWARLATIALQSCSADSKARSEMAAQILQTVSGSLETAFSSSLENATELAQLSRNVMTLHSSPIVDGETTLLESHDDRLFSIFRSCYNGIISDISTPELRELCYQICTQYLRSIAASTADKAPTRRRLILRSMRVLGDRPLQTVCDDAYSGTVSNRVSALLFLNELVLLANTQDAKHIIEVVSRQNLVGVLVETIRLMPQELAEAPPTEVNALISAYTATLTLLLCLSRSRQGATEVMNAGLFQAVRESGLFTTDPDLGFGKFRFGDMPDRMC